MKDEKCFLSRNEEVSYMYSVMKKVGRKNKLVKKFKSIKEAREYLSQENERNYVPAAKAGRQWYLVNVWDINRGSHKIPKGISNGSQKTLYNPANESKLFIQYKPEVVPFPVSSSIPTDEMIDELSEVA